MHPYPINRQHGQGKPDFFLELRYFSNILDAADHDYSSVWILRFNGSFCFRLPDFVYQTPKSAKA
jgi:hypothetical protein